MSRRGLVVLNSALRAAYGVGALLSPSAMAAARMVPDTDDRPEDRLFVRGFGAHQLAVAAIGLASGRSRRLERSAIALAVGLDVVDAVTAAVEARGRGRMGEDVIGGLALSTGGLVLGLAALRAPD
jgi:hypothetical protein